MNNVFEKYINDLQLNEPARLQAIIDVENKLGIEFPIDYKEFLLFSNGCEGSIGESYICIWPIEELIEANEASEVDEYTPGLVLFGSDGGGEAFAFDMRNNNKKYIMVPLMLEFNAIIEQGNSLAYFFERSYNGQLFEK
jgi:hypothetical protein